MANSKRKCSQCKKSFKVEELEFIGSYRFCSTDCKIEFTVKNRKSLAKKGKPAVDKNKRVESASRTAMLDKLQDLVNQFVLYRDRDKPCCTCGKSNPSIKYDAGHYRSRGACPELRFELTNIHRQCSVNCNGWGSGMRKEYREFIEHYYGKEHLDWLDGPHELLKDKFPDNHSIEDEIKRYRKILRDAGLTPRA